MILRNISITWQETTTHSLPNISVVEIFKSPARLHWPPRGCPSALSVCYLKKFKGLNHRSVGDFGYKRKFTIARLTTKFALFGPCEIFYGMLEAWVQWKGCPITNRANCTEGGLTILTMKLGVA